MPDHTIAENLARLQAARMDISTAITAKGGTVPSGAGFEDFPTAIASIPEGTGDHDLFGVPATAQNPKLFTATFSTTGTTAALAKMAEYWPFDEVTQDGKYYWGEDNYFTNGGATSYADEYVYAYYGSSVLNYFGSMSGESDKTVVIGSNFFLGIFSRCAIFCGYAEDKDGNVSKCMGMIPMTSHSDPIKLAFDNGGVKQYSNSSVSNADNQYTSILYGSDRYTVKDLLIAVTSQYIPLDPGAECTIGDDQAYLYSSIAALAKTPTAHAAPPIEFESDGSSLKNWAIFGNDPGVGEQTKNLVDLGNYDSTNYGLRGYVQDGMLRIVGKYNSDAAHMPFRFDVTLASGSYILSGALIEVNDIYINLLRYTTRPSYEIVGNDKGSGFPFVVNAAGDYCVAAYIAKAAYNKDIDVTIPIMLRPADTSSDFEPYGYKIPVETRERGKNLYEIPNNASLNGVNFVGNVRSGTVTADGKNTDTPSGSLFYNISNYPEGDYYVSGCPDGGSSSTYNIHVYDVTTRQRAVKWDQVTLSDRCYSSSDQTEVHIYAAHEYRITIAIATGATVNNLVFHPMLRPADTSSDFEPYWKVADTTPIYTQTQLGTGDTLTKERAGVDIPTVDGENCITVATTTQPAAMTIAYAEPEE